MSEKPVGDGFVIDEITGEVKLATPKKIRVREKNQKKSGGATPPGKTKGAKKRAPTNGHPRKIEAILSKENTPEKIQQAGVLVKKSPSNIAHQAEILGLGSAEKIYGAIIDIAMDEKLAPEVRGPFLKFVADRTIAKRVTKLLPLPTVPKVRTLDDIEIAMQEVIRLMQVGEITHDECQSVSKSYENLATIMYSKQMSVVQQRLLQMQDSVIKTINKEVLLTEIEERLMDYEAEDRLTKFQEWFHIYLTTDTLLKMLGWRIKNNDDKIKILKEITKICK